MLWTMTLLILDDDEKKRKVIQSEKQMSVL